ARASVILDLYQGVYRGRRLRPGDRILSVDAKPSIQARGRCRPTAAAARGKPVRVEHEYVRHGALALLAALDVHTGKVFASTPATTGITPFMDLMGQVMSLPEYKDAPRVFVIADNGSDHRGQAAVKRLHDAWPNAIMIHTPVHASWLNQAEIFFSITQKKVISPNDFASLDELARTLLAFVDRYNQTARPFNWKFTAADLARLLDRISTREHAARQPAGLPQAARQPLTNFWRHPLSHPVSHPARPAGDSGRTFWLVGATGFEPVPLACKAQPNRRGTSPGIA